MNGSENNLQFIYNAIYYLVKQHADGVSCHLVLLGWQLVYRYKKCSPQEQFDLLLSKLREQCQGKK